MGAVEGQGGVSGYALQGQEPMLHTPNEQGWGRRRDERGMEGRRERVWERVREGRRWRVGRKRVRER